MLVCGGQFLEPAVSADARASQLARKIAAAERRGEPESSVRFLRSSSGISEPDIPYWRIKQKQRRQKTEKEALFAKIEFGAFL